jgi:hypothetical protein
MYMDGTTTKLIVGTTKGAQITIDVGYEQYLNLANVSSPFKVWEVLKEEDKADSSIAFTFIDSKRGKKMEKA